MRHAVLGAGGIGGLVGGVLAKAGHPVTLLVRPGRRDHYPGQLSLKSEMLGTFEAPVQTADLLDGQFDVVWITVKATALEAALRAVPPEKLGDSVLVPLLNGVDHVEQLRESYGAERVLPGTIQVETEQIGPGRVRHFSAFADVQVAPRPATQARAEALCEELRGAGLVDQVRRMRQGGLRCCALRGGQGCPRANPRNAQRGSRRFPQLDAKRRGGRAAAGARGCRGTHPPWWH